MARHRGSSRPEILARLLNLAQSRTQNVPVRSGPNRGLVFCAFLALAVGGVWCLSSAAWAQVAVEDVHVKPRITPPEASMYPVEFAPTW